MSIFEATRTISFGPQMPEPGPYRPEEALFSERRIPRDTAFGLSWARDTRALGYHIFRSMSVRHVRDRSMHSLWSATYGDAVQHFTVGPEVSRVVDNYDLRGATMMYYWVLSQDNDGVLRQVEQLRTHIADEQFCTLQHLLLEDERTRVLREQSQALAQPPQPAQAHAPSAQAPAPQAAAPRASAPVQAPAPAPVPRALRPVTFIPYQAPEIFQILETEGVQSYEVYIGNQMPDAALSDAMWDGSLMPGNPMRSYRLPGNLEGFGDRVSPPGSQAFLCIFAVQADGSRKQPALGIPPSPPGFFAELT